jgi:hypothetical protein
MSAVLRAVLALTIVFALTSFFVSEQQSRKHAREAQEPFESFAFLFGTLPSSTSKNVFDTFASFGNSPRMTRSLDHDAFFRGSDSLDLGDNVGSIFFGHSNKQHNIVQPPTWDLTPLQKTLLDDEAIDLNFERARCTKYGFGMNRTQRRRIFWGAPLADESMELLQTIATEAFGLYHTAAFVEANSTHTATTREWRFPPDSTSLHVLQSMFGKETSVTVDYFIDGPEAKDLAADKFTKQHVQRQGVLERWKRNGMRPDDIGFLSDTDETFTRDFLRAVQMCDIPEFRPGQNCLAPKILATTLTFESSPECVLSNHKLWHPDLILGECLDVIGDKTLHVDPKRVWKDRHSYRVVEHGRHQDYTKYLSNVSDNGQYPLWNAADIRGVGGGRQIQGNTEEFHFTGFHFHNFFHSTEEIRHKYQTYGEWLKKAATAPLSMIHDDLSVSVSCAHGWPNLGQKQYHLEGYTQHKGVRPIFFENEAFRKARHDHLLNIILEDEQKYGAANATCTSVSCKNT